MDASSSTNSPSKQYMDVKVKNKSQFRAAKKELRRQPNGTILRIYISADVPKKLKLTLESKVEEDGFILLDEDPEKADKEEGTGSS